jgi:DNA-binding beta-propeller fold protein YncE
MKHLRVLGLLCPLLTGTITLRAAPTLFLMGQSSSVSIFNRATLNEQGYVAAPGLTRSVALTPDGTRAYIATGGIIRIVSAITHMPIGRLPSNNAAIVRISPDGRRLYAANVNGSVWVYDTASGAVTRRIPFLVKDSFDYAVADMTVSADGTLIAMAAIESMCGEFGCPSGDPIALISEINGQTGALIQRLPIASFSPFAFVTSLAVSGDDASLYVANGSEILKMNAANGHAIKTIPFAASRVAVDAAAGRLYAGTAASQPALEVFSTASDSSEGSVALTGPVTALAFSPDHATVFAGGCAANEGNFPFPCSVAAISAASLQVSATGVLNGVPSDFAAGAFSNTLWVANAFPVELTAVNTGSNLVSGEAETNYVPLSMAVTPSGNKVYTANADGTISVVNGLSLARENVINPGQNIFSEAGKNCVSPDGQRAYITLNRVLEIDTSNDQITASTPEIPFGCVISPDSSTLYTFNASFDETTDEYNLQVSKYSASTLVGLAVTGFGSGQLPSELFVSPDGSTLYLITPFLAYVIPTATFIPERTIPLNLCIDAALSPDGASLYCLDQPTDTTQPDSVQVIATATGAVEHMFSTGVWAFGNVALTPDGTSLYLSLQIPGVTVTGALERMNVTTGAIALVNTRLFGPLAIR